MNWRLKFSIVNLLFILLLSACSQKQSVDYDFSHKVNEAFQFCKTNGLDTQKVILVNFAIPSGKKRLVVWDFTHNQIIYSCLVAHGKCDNDKKFSNLPSNLNSIKLCTQNSNSVSATIFNL